MCWFCDGVKKFINKSVVVYDDTAAKVIKEYSYPDSTVTLKITAGGYRGNSNTLTGMRELKGLKYCPNCGEKIEDFDNCASKENDMASKAIAEREFTKRYRDIVNLYERLAKGGVECSMTVDDKNGICTIYSHGIELADDSERINKSFEDVLEEKENDQ